jgi:EAL domain-containing protein (putative c-di-GMP-specific phosphodiesterase class I)
MYWAKSRGKDQYAVFEMKMNAGAFIRLQLDLDLRRALERQQFELHYQPIVSVQTGRIVGVETLLRWQHPSRGCIPPDQFIPVAEETGLITPIGEWILWTACQQTKLWHEAGYDSLRVGINLSTRQLQDQDLPELIGRILKEVQLDPTLLELELTESIALMQNLEANIKALKKISQMGVHLAIDDFGTGYSSLVYMKKFPIDTLKIDRSFVAGIGYDSGDMAITKAIIAMTHTLGLNIIAEGVETLEQLAHLRQQQCDEIQGYLVSRPQPAHELSKLLEQDREADILTTISAGSH